MKKLFTYYSTYVAFIATGVAAYWLQLAPDDQKAVLDAYPILKLGGPAIGLVSFLVARGLPQAPKA